MSLGTVVSVGSVLTGVGLQLGLLWMAPRRSKGSSGNGGSSSGSQDNSTNSPMVWNACGNTDVAKNPTLSKDTEFSLGPSKNDVTAPASSMTFVPSSESGNPVQVAMLEVLQSRISSWRGSTVTLALPTMSTDFQEYTSTDPILPFPACIWAMSSSRNYVYTPRVFSDTEVSKYGLKSTTFISGNVTDISAPSAIAASWGASQLQQVGQTSADWKIGNLRKLAGTNALAAGSEPLPVLAFYEDASDKTTRVGSLTQISGDKTSVTIRFGNNTPEIVPTAQLLDLYAVDPHPDNATTPVDDTPTPVDNTGYVVALWAVVLACVFLYLFSGRFFRKDKATNHKETGSEVEMTSMMSSFQKQEVASDTLKLVNGMKKPDITFITNISSDERNWSQILRNLRQLGLNPDEYIKPGIRLGELKDAIDQLT